MVRPESSIISKFMAAIRRERLDIGDAARAAGISFQDAANVFAYGVQAGKLRFVDNGPGDRFIDEGRSEWLKE